MIRADHDFSNTHSVFVRYAIDDSSSIVPYFGTPPGTYVPGFPTLHEARNQYFTVQDRRNLGHEMLNELRFGINRTTASSSKEPRFLPALPKVFLRLLTKFQTSDFAISLAKRFSTNSLVDTKDLGFTIATENFLGCPDRIPPLRQIS